MAPLPASVLTHLIRRLVVRAPSTGRRGQIRFRLSEDARVVVRLQSAAARQPVAKRRLAGRLVLASRRGLNVAPLRGRIVRRSGRFLLVVIASDEAGNRSSARSRPFALPRGG